MAYSIITVNAENVDEYGIFCVKNKKHKGYQSKRTWLGHRFKEGLRFKLIVTDDNKSAGFLEYIPGEYTWRAVQAPDYLVIHCIWVHSEKFHYKGMASELIKSCISDAKSSVKKGVAVVTSDGPWMARSEVFLKNGFEYVESAEPHFQLLAYRLGNWTLPSFIPNLNDRLNQYQELQLLYTNQCPYIGKAIAELPPVAKAHGVDLKLIEMTDPAEARKRMPSPYGVFNLMYKGNLLADHPISATRFKNILEKELNLAPLR